MPNPVVVSEIATRFRPLTAEEEPAVQYVLDDAWAMLLARVPDLEDRMTSGAVSTELASAVVSAMALRVLRNPDGIRQWSVDDVSFTRDQALAAGLLYATDDEVALLFGDSQLPGAFTIRAKRPPCAVPTPPVYGGSCWPW